MRFDLECISVGSITSDKMEKLSEILYGDSIYIKPMNWDSKHAQDTTNRGSIDTTNFKNFSNSLDHFFVSGLSEGSTLDLNTILKKDGTMTMLFNGGDFYSYRKLSSWSLNSVSKLIEFDNIDGLYKCKIDQDIDKDTISVFTVTLNNGRYFHIKKIYNFIEYDNVSVFSTFNNADKTIDYLYTIKDDYIYLNTKEIIYSENLGTYTSGNAIFPLSEFPAKDLSILGFNDNQYAIKSGCVIFNSYKSDSIKTGDNVNVTYKVTPILTYKQKSRIDSDDIVFKNVNISPRSVNFKSGSIGIYNCYDNEMMPYELKFSDNIPSQIKYKDSAKISATLYGVDGIPLSTRAQDGSGIKLEITSNNAIWQETKTSEFSSDTGIDGTISATVSIDQEKIGTYIQKEWVQNVSIDGATKGQITLPFRMHMIGNSTDSYTSNDFKKIYLYIIYANDPMMGMISPGSKAKPIVEYFTYKQSETDSELEAQEKTLQSYYVNGRKVAYVKLLQSTNPSSELTSLFIKPINVEVVPNKSFNFRELYIKSERISTKVRGTDRNTYSCKSWHISNDSNRPASGTDWQNFWVIEKAYMPVINWEEGKNYFPTKQYIGLASTQIQNTQVIASDLDVASSGKYEYGVLPYDTLNIMSSVAPYATIITYNDPFPIDADIIGYWMVTDRKIEIKASYTDELIKIESDILEIDMTSLESETAFTIAGFDIPGAQTSLSEFGYFNISDYLKSPFKLNSFCFYCINSDAINKQCIHKNIAYRENFILDSGNIGCARTEAYELANPEIGSCPGLNAKLINPFIL